MLLDAVQLGSRINMQFIDRGQLMSNKSKREISLNLNLLNSERFYPTEYNGAGGPSHIQFWRLDPLPSLRVNRTHEEFLPIYEIFDWALSRGLSFGRIDTDGTFAFQCALYQFSRIGELAKQISNTSIKCTPTSTEDGILVILHYLRNYQTHISEHKISETDLQREFQTTEGETIPRIDRIYFFDDLSFEELRKLDSVKVIDKGIEDLKAAFNLFDELQKSFGLRWLIAKCMVIYIEILNDRFTLSKENSH
jgi:hypothetical protein